MHTHQGELDLGGEGAAVPGGLDDDDAGRREALHDLVRPDLRDTSSQRWVQWVHVQREPTKQDVWETLGRHHAWVMYATDRVALVAGVSEVCQRISKASECERCACVRVTFLCVPFCSG